MKNKNIKSIISLLAVSIIIGIFTCGSVLANPVQKDDLPPGWWLSSETTDDEIPDWLYEQLYGSSNANTSSTSSGGLQIDIIDIPAVTSTPTPPPPTQPVPPTPTPVPTPAESKPSIQVTPPPPPEPTSQEEWVYDDGGNIHSGTASISLDLSDAKKNKNESLDFIVNNWWIFLGVGIVIILVAVVLVVKKNK